MNQRPVNIADPGGALDVLCPMHAILDATGHIKSVGPTLQKLRPISGLPGHRFLEVFELNRPRNITTMSGLLASHGKIFYLQFRDDPRTALKGIVVPGPVTGQAIVNLSFGISVLEGVRDYALTISDFAATELAIEMLYLSEAKSVAMQASQMLNLRLQGAMVAAEKQAFTDVLTGLQNRRAIDQVLENLITGHIDFALMHLDLDFFKAVNDMHGHAAGDHVLQNVARIMESETRDTDVVARVGGDEFVILFPGLTDRRKLDQLARRMIRRLQVPIPFGETLCKISASAGTVVSFDYKTLTCDRLLADADAALYASKRDGRGCHQFYRPELRTKPKTKETCTREAAPGQPR